MDSEEIDLDLDLIKEQNALGTDSFSSLVEQTVNTSDENLTPIFLKWKALLKLYPEQSHDLREFMGQLEPRSSKFLMLSGLLSLVGHNEAQEALVDLINSYDDAKSRVSIIGDLGLVESPNANSVNALRELAELTDDEGVAQTSRLALGNMARNLRRPNPETYNELLRKGLASLIRCQGFEECTNALHVLGNMGADETLDVAKKFWTQRKLS